MTAVSGQTIETRLSSRARHLTLTVYPEGRAVLTVPPRSSQRAVDEFLRQHRGWLDRQLDKCRRQRAECIFLPAGRRDYLRNREKARRLVLDCLERHNRLYGLAFSRVSIKNLYASWGSCSAKGNLNFNYKIVHLPIRLAEYIVVHELCHRQEMNHSRRFWALVARAVPDHRERRRELHKYQL